MVPGDRSFQFAPDFPDRVERTMRFLVPVAINIFRKDFLTTAMAYFMLVYPRVSMIVHPKPSGSSACQKGTVLNGRGWKG